MASNDWSVKLHAGEVNLVEEIKNATAEQEKAFKQRVFEHVKNAETPACREPSATGETVGHLNWYGGPKAARGWALFLCKACGKVHGRLSFMA